MPKACVHVPQSADSQKACQELLHQAIMHGKCPADNATGWGLGADLACDMAGSYSSCPSKGRWTRWCGSCSPLWPAQVPQRLLRL